MDILRQKMLILHEEVLVEFYVEIEKVIVNYIFNILEVARPTYCKSGVALKRNGSLKRIRLDKQGQTAAAMVVRHRTTCRHGAIGSATDL